MRIVVTGAGGLLATAIIREFQRTEQVVALEHAALDITDAPAVERAIHAARPDVVINCVAHNGVDRAEMDPRSALAVNALAVRRLAAVARATRAVLVHYSTDFVFNGDTVRPYTEVDPPNPRSVYGASKLLGDWFALESPTAYVVRVESLFGEAHHGRPARGSLDTIVGRIRAGEPVPVFVDRTVSPSYTVDIATATRELLVRPAAPGLYHCVNTGAATWAEVATEAARLLQLPFQAHPITLETAGLKAPRPKYCALSNAKLKAAGIEMPTWQDALRRYLLRDSHAEQSLQEEKRNRG